MTRLNKFVLISLFIFAPQLLLAQVDTGAILGTVKDTSGAVIPGATVTLKSDDTGVTTTASSGSSGEYTFSPVKIGHYAIAAEFKGFQRVEHTQVSVDV